LLLCVGIAYGEDAETSDLVEIPAEVLRDKIRGGLLGQMLGNLNGLPHENKYIHEPGDVEEYTPSLPEGARTDDDTDFEWVYIVAMQEEDAVFLPEVRIAQLWRSRINTGIYCSNLYARRLMDLGIEPPLTGSTVLNPWAEFNISGQFLCESFGLLAPGMPRTASRIGLHYTRVAIDDEPAQSTQLFCTMIACAFVENDMNVLVDKGVEALDPKSVQRQIVDDVRAWHRQHPDAWRTTRRLLKEKYSQADGGMRDRNGYELTTGSTVAALLYGEGDLPETLRMAFNFGWDADNSAATAGTIVGVMRGYRHMLSQGWPIVDRYRNTTRDGMPMDETITSFADRVIDLAEKVITENGGRRVIVRGRPVYRVVAEGPGSVYPLASPSDHQAPFRKRVTPRITSAILGEANSQQRAEAAYLALCLDMASELQKEHPEAWRRAVAALDEYPKLVDYLHSNRPDTPAHRDLKKKAVAVGIVPTQQ
jgi:hypothetical protein